MKRNDIAVVLGNGESRQSFNLDCIPKNIVTVGCNAIYRDYAVDHLVCCDKRMIAEVELKTASLIYTRPKYYQDFRKLKKNKQINLLPDIPYQGVNKKDQPDHWNSGPYAVLLACHLNYQQIYLIGFDLYSDNNQFNNIYKNSLNYQSATAPAIDPSNWIYQIKKLFHCYSQKNFVIVNKDDWVFPREWQLPNVKFLNIDKFNRDLFLT
jgi:hypothetical protein